MRNRLALAAALTVALVILPLLARRGGQVGSFPHARFAEVDVRVIETGTTNPVVGAVVHAVCLGGTPYAKNFYRTDANGIARVTSYERMTAVGVTMDGYRETFHAFFSSNGGVTNAVVSLPRVVQ